MEDQRLFLLDAFALIYRAYYAFIKNPIKNSKGVNTSASYGFTLFLHDLLKKEKPSHLAVVFDSPGATDRAVQHSFYKANREAMPEDIANMIPYIKQIVKAFNIPMLELSGFEADDIIGTIAKEKEKTGHQVYMVTPDKDFAQLVSDNIFIYKPSRQGNGVEIMGVPEVLEKWEIEDPLQVIDILGMWGDAVDNIPGIPGVGEKTAKKLIKEYGSMENMLDHSHELKGKLREKVEANKEQALVSKMLATIILDVPVSVEDEDLLISDFDKDALSSLFAELEFRNLGKRILGEEYTVNKPNTSAQMDLFGGDAQDNGTIANEEKGKTIENTEHNYTLVDKENELKKLITMLSKQEQIAFDTETTGLDVMNESVLGISFSVHANEGFYIPLNDDNRASYLALLKPLFENEQVGKIAQNLKYDMHILANYGIELKGSLFDTMLAHYLLQPDLRHNMDYLAESYLGYTPVSLQSLIGKKGKNQKSFASIELEKQKEYAAEDADITWQLAQMFDGLCKENALDKVLKEVEMPLVPVLAKMERNGVKLDEKFLNDYNEQLTAELIETRTKIFETANTEFNMDSPKQLGEVLFDQMGIPYKGQKTKTGQYATGEDKLLSYQKDYPIVHDILEYRQIAKLRSTYVDALPKLIDPKTGKVHTSFSQAVAATGRLSSVNPNLQNIPIRTERGRKVRKAFIPTDENHILLAADYSQIELRLIAELSNDQAMLEAFNQGLDIHAATAAKVFDVPLEKVTREMRSNAKTVNFGIIYGVSAFGLSQQTDLSRTESKEVIESYFNTYPGIKTYMDENINQARENGFVSTILGRKRIIKEINSRNAILRGRAERNAINTPVQGSAADMIKLAMIAIDKEMTARKMESLMTLQVHDELVFDVVKSEVEELKELVIRLMQDALPGLKVPIIAEVGLGDNWLEAH
ncbi:MAG: DNA polymerase-1 [Chitinophagales bacterium]|jgi:DNA polymerase-1